MKEGRAWGNYTPNKKLTSSIFVRRLIKKVDIKKNLSKALAR